ncbi:hypothetical protein ES705_33763 [subsurface metagenome]
MGIPLPTGTAADTTETLLDGCEDAWNQLIDGGVISTIDSTDKKKGSYSVKLQVSTDVAADDILATELIDPSVVMTADTHLKFWIKSSVLTAAGDLVLMISEEANCAGAEGTVLKSTDIPICEAGVWTEHTIPLGYMSRSDITFVTGASDTITTAAGNFLTAGFTIGDSILITGTDSANDDVTVVPTNVEETTLTMDTASGIIDKTVGAAILNAMATYGAVISLGIKMHEDKGECTIHIDDVRRVVAGTASHTKQHVFKPMQTVDHEFNPDCPLYPYTLDIFRDQGLPFRYLGSVVNTLALNFSSTDKVLKATCGIIAKNIGKETGTEALSLETTNPFVWSNATITISDIGTVPATGEMNDIESFSLTLDNVCAAKYALNNSVLPRKIIRTGVRTIPVSFTMEFLSRTEYDKFAAGTERSFTIKFVGAKPTDETGAAYYTLQIDLPSVRYLTYPISIDGPGPITCAVTGKAKYYASTGYTCPIRITLHNTEDLNEYKKA